MRTEKYDPPKIGYSIREACRASSIGRTTLYSHIAAGRLRAVRAGRRAVGAGAEQGAGGRGGQGNEVELVLHGVCLGHGLNGQGRGWFRASCA